MTLADADPLVVVVGGAEAETERDEEDVAEDVTDCAGDWVGSGDGELLPLGDGEWLGESVGDGVISDARLRP